ncbi:MAG: flagellar biosynthesis protein FlhA [Candidatus Sericytochromatia bacterium]|nr:flagellar biosynthesis protein FlhA [Candidatus Tanganyikabacteria bacterium]
MFARLGRSSDIVLAVIVVMVVAMMILPVPAVLLDLFLVFNITASMTMLLIAIYVQEPLEFNTMPSLLLILTLFRLSLNVSTTRTILLDADHAPQVVKAFGQFVVGGNYVVGIVVFLILVIIQFVVITNGAGRISEVAARFTLDAMPGKQMAIDADLNTGLIKEDEARARRQKIQREADFYGTMDGASKFVRGDAVAGLIIVAINIIGGILIGVLQQGRPLADAAAIYTILSIGDGLVAQIPALLISTGTGILVSRAVSDLNMGSQIAGQVLSNPRPLAIVATLMALLGVTPGMPSLPFLAVAAALGGVAWVIGQQKRRAAAEAEEAAKRAPPAEPPKGPENVMGLLKVDPMELEIGYRLIPLVDAAQGGDLLERITMIRRQIALKLGLVLPPIRVRDNLQLKPKEYRINLRGVEIARGEVQMDHYLAMNSGMAIEDVEGIPTTEPVFGLPAFWITEENKERAEMLGYTVFDISSVIATHLMEVIKAHAPEILTRADVQALLDNLKADHEQLISLLIPDLMQVSDVMKILANLLRDRVSIRDLVPVLEALETNSRITKDTDTLTEYSRLAIARSICKANLAPDGSLPVITLDPAVEQVLAGSIQNTDQGAFVALEPGMATRLVRAVQEETERLMAQGHQPVVLCSSKVRLVFRRLIERKLPNLAVMSYNEVVPPQTEVRSLGVISLT